MDKMNGTTMNIVAENIEKIRKLFPEAFTEGKVNFDTLKEVMGEYIDGREERYSFTWNGKSKARMLAQTPSTGTLRPCPEESVDWENTKNIFIEGDNLEVLKLLQKSYHKKVKMIYIDPPYNTGKDFVYKDNFKDNIKNYKEITGQVDGEGRSLSSNPETSGRYHTDWLNMMYPRLKLARNLLKEDGVIFTSIDFREVMNLRNLMNEIFGEENLIFDVSVVNNLKGRNDREGIATCHEHLLIYKKSQYVPKGLSLSEEQKAEYKEIDENGELFQFRDLRKRGGADTRTERPKMFFPLFVNPKTGTVSDKQTVDFSIEVYPQKSDGSDGCWRWGKDKVLENLNILYGKKVSGKEHWNISYRVYLNVNGEERRSTPKSVWTGPQFSTDSGTKTLSSYFKGLKAKKFTPKPVELLLQILDQSIDKDDLILDFFAGSGSMGDAVFRYNTKRNARVRFILVQYPEPIDDKMPKALSDVRTISDMCRHRLKRVPEILKNDDKRSLDFGFKVFKLDSTNIKPWDVDFNLSEQDLVDQIDNIKDDRTKDDVLYEILIKYGLDLTLPIAEHNVAGKKVFDIGMGALIISLSDSITLDVVEGIAKLKDELNPEIMRVVFKDSGFKDDVVKTNAVQILKQAGIEDVRSL